MILRAVISESLQSDTEMWPPSASVTWFLSRISVVPNYSVLTLGENGPLWFIPPETYYFVVKCMETPYFVELI